MTTAAAPVPESSGPGPLTLILNTFFSPGSTMEDLIRRPRFVAALALITICGMITMGIAYQKGVIQNGIRAKMESDSRMERMTPEQRERVIEQTGKYIIYGIVGGALVAPTIGLLVTSGVFLLFTNVILGAQARFGQLLAVVTHGWLPLMLHGLVSIPILLAKDPEEVDFENIVPMSNLGFLFPATEHAKLHALGVSLDLFSFWVIALLTIGIARVTGKSKGLSLVVVLVPWALYVMVFKVLRA